MQLFGDHRSVSMEPSAYYRNLYDSRSPVVDGKMEIHRVRVLIVHGLWSFSVTPPFIYMLF